MSTTRVYLPATMSMLSDLPATLEKVRLGHAVTAGLREGYAEGDLEELEYVAFTHAAQDSIALLYEDAKAPRRRVVLSVDAVVHQPLVGGLGDSTVNLAGPPELASIHVDGDGAVDDVAAAVAAYPKAESGDSDAEFTVGAVEDHELEWYDPTELSMLLDRLQTN